MGRGIADTSLGYGKTGRGEPECTTIGLGVFTLVLNHPLLGAPKFDLRPILGLVRFKVSNT